MLHRYILHARQTILPPFKVGFACNVRLERWNRSCSIPNCTFLSSWRTNVPMKKFIDNIELCLSFAGLLVIMGMPALLSPSSPQGFWKTVAITAIGVGLLHGIIFWVIRRRQRKIRERSIMEIREMLADVVKNQLAVIDLYLPEDEEQAMVEEELNGIKDSLREISAEVDALSDERLRDWKEQYPEALENATQLEAA